MGAGVVYSAVMHKNYITGYCNNATWVRVQELMEDALI